MGTTDASGALTMRPFRLPPRPAVRSMADAIRLGQRWRSRSWWHRSSETMEWQRANAEHFERSLEAMRRWDAGVRTPIGHLWGAVLRRDGSTLDLGLMSCRVVTTAGVNFIIDAMQGLVEPELLRYHGVGTSSTAESSGQTALGAELTTQYTPANTRATGSLGELAGSPNVFETVATVTVSAGVTLTEHAVFSQAGTGGGTMLDRSVFTGVPLSTSESIATTYQFTLPAGG